MVAKTKGTTIVELLVVLLILTVISQMVFLPLSSTDFRRIKNTGMQLKSDLQYAQRMTVIDAKTYGVMLSSNYYMLYYKNTDDPVYYRVKPDVFFESGMRLQHNNSIFVEYTPRGTISGGSPQTIRLDYKKHHALLTLTPVTGRAEITEIK